MDDLKHIIKLLEEQGKQISRIKKILESQQDKSPEPTPLKIEVKASKKYKSLKGGICFLIDNGFFNKMVSVKEVQDELKKEGYIYPYNSIDRSLRRDFHQKKILTRDEIEGIWKYALRK